VICKDKLIAEWTKAVHFKPMKYERITYSLLKHARGEAIEIINEW
jgi:hypothetical protein